MHSTAQLSWLLNHQVLSRIQCILTYLMNLGMWQWAFQQSTKCVLHILVRPLAVPVHSLPYTYVISPRQCILIFVYHNHVFLILTGHGAELPYVFHIIGSLETPEEKQLAGTVSKYWGTFVKNGDPNSPEDRDEKCPTVVQVSIISYCLCRICHLLYLVHWSCYALDTRICYGKSTLCSECWDWYSYRAI